AAVFHRNPAGVPAVVEHPPQQLGQLRSEVGGDLHGKAIPQAVQPRPRHPVSEAAVVSTKPFLDARQPGVAFVNTAVETANSGEGHDYPLPPSITSRRLVPAQGRPHWQKAHDTSSRSSGWPPRSTGRLPGADSPRGAGIPTSWPRKTRRRVIKQPPARITPAPGAGRCYMPICTSARIRNIPGNRGQRKAGPLREYSSPARAEIPASANVTDVIFRRARAEPGEVMLRKRTGAGSWQDVTASQFRAEVATLANGLMAAGIEPGDRVALMSRSRYEWTLIDYAIWAAGAVSVPVYETSSAEQVAWTLSDSSAHAVFAETSMHEEIISSVRGKLPGLAHLWMISALDAVASGGPQIAEEQLEQRRTGRAATDQATIIYTSGTTGRPKGCELTHGNLLAEVRSAVSALPEIFAAPACSPLLFLPLAHAYARTIQIGCLEAGAILGHWPDTATLAEGLTEFRPTVLLAVPRVFEKLYDAAWQQASASAGRARIFAAAAETAIDWSKAMGGAAAGGSAAGPALRLRHALFGRLVYRKLRAAAGGRVQYAISGGAPLGERVGRLFRAGGRPGPQGHRRGERPGPCFRGCGITVLEGYGLTETSGGATVNRPGHHKIGTVGQPVPGVTTGIADDGEILLRGPNVFPGYWHDPAASAEVLDHEGWLHSGDIGALDDEG